MIQPEGFLLPENSDKVCLLKKSFYGLKQSSKKWYKRFDNHMIKIGYSRSSYDSCVYIKRWEILIYSFFLGSILNV